MDTTGRQQLLPATREVAQEGHHRTAVVHREQHAPHFRGMDTAWTLGEVLRDLDGGLRDLYGERYGGLVLYGSRVRGEA